MVKSGGYKALLQSLDERDVSSGLGRSIALKKNATRSGCCCSCCRSWLLYTCVAVAVVSALMLVVGVPLLLSLPVTSPYHWTHWKQMVMPPESTASSAHHHHPNVVPVNQSRVSDGQGQGSVNDGPILGNHTEPVFGDDDHSDPIDHADHSDHLEEHEQSQLTLNLAQKTVVLVREMLQWSKERYDSMPKVHLIIGLSSLLLVVLTVIWVLVYRRIARRRRRRTLGKLVTDLQSGDNSLLLNSDSDED